jgi:hypothetical protein
MKVKTEEKRGFLYLTMPRRRLIATRFQPSLSPVLRIALIWIVGARQQLKTHVNKY